MRPHVSSTLVALLLAAAPLSAYAADAVGQVAQDPITSTTALLTALGGLVATTASLVASIRGVTKARAETAEARAETALVKQTAEQALAQAEAMRDALAHFGAHRQAVGVVLNFPGQKDRGVFDYMTQGKWALAEWTAHNAQIPTDPRFRDDMLSVDVLIIQGATREEGLAAAPFLADLVPPGAAVIFYNESGGVQHAFKPWGPAAQGGAAIGTVDLWARGAYARRAYMAAYQGARKGSLAELKAQRQAG